MKAVILAAGKGTRMKELTNELPKPMLRVGLRSA
jgi:NDP-sugar pyrophosphorylase family protein